MKIKLIKKITEHKKKIDKIFGVIQIIIGLGVSLILFLKGTAPGSIALAIFLGGTMLLVGISALKNRKEIEEIKECDSYEVLNE